MPRTRIFYVFFTISFYINAQVPDGPGGVGNTSGTSTLRMWFRPESGVTLSSGQVSAWADQSGYGNSLTGPSGSRPVTATSSSLNNQTVMRFSGAQYFSSALSGPNVNDITLFLACNGSSYQSLFRFQNTAGTYLVYPWEFGGGRTFISSSDGGTGSGVNSGLVSNVNNIGGARYSRNTTNGMQTYLNGAVNAQRNSANAALPNQAFFCGRYNPGASEYPACDIGDLIFYYSALNDVQMIIVQNYLAAKYNGTLSSNDNYTMDDAANGNYDFDVAGIGRINGSTLHDDSQGTGIVRILNPSGLGNGEYYFWGHDNGTLGAWGVSDYPAGLQGRLARVWRGSEVGAITSFDVRFDLTGLGSVTANQLRLLIDTDNDGTFADETTGGGGIISGASLVSGNVYQFTGVTGLNNTIRFTLGTTNYTATPLPIELTGFSAEVNGDRIDVSWKTASEKNCDYFEVERSADAINFTKLFQVNSKAPGGNSQSILNYLISDNSPLTGTSYYRLKQVDKDGAWSYKELVAANYSIKNFGFVVYPNPVKTEFTIDFSGIKNTEKVDVRLKSATGRQVYQSSFYIEEGRSEKIRIKPGETLNAGVYLCTLTVSNKEFIFKIIVD
jgi:hypothetical protein